MSDSIEKDTGAALAQPPTYVSSSKAEDLGRDDALLASLGYKAELKREFNAMEVFGLAFSIMGLLPSIASTLVYSLPNGGAVGLVYPFFLSRLLILRFGAGLLRHSLS
jgi:hypothetical protein